MPAIATCRRLKHCWDSCRKPSTLPAAHSISRRRKMTPSSAKDQYNTPDTGNVMDERMFNAFLDMVEDSAAVMLRKHCDTAKKYLEAIHLALRNEDCNAMADAAHPLKSSSRQIGAHHVAELAQAAGRCRQRKSAFSGNLPHSRKWSGNWNRSSASWKRRSGINSIQTQNNHRKKL